MQGSWRLPRLDFLIDWSIDMKSVVRFEEGVWI